jgi:hypothetical protein
MNHFEAVELRAAERYLLGELTGEQRDQFEEHFFGCLECAGEVRSGAVLVDNARHILIHEPAPRPVVPVAAHGNRGWFGWLQPAWGFAAAAVLLAGILSYQDLVTIPALKHTVGQPQMLASFSLVTAGSRGAGAITVPAPKDRPFGLYLDIPAKESFAYYTVEVQTESGSRPIRVQVSAEQAKDTVQIFVPAGVLQPGNATLLVEGHSSDAGPVSEVARYPFEIQYQ